MERTDLSTWKRDFGRGLIVIVPITITAFLVYVLYSFVSTFVPTMLLDGAALEAVLPGVGDRGREIVAGLLRVVAVLSIVAALMYLLGHLARTTAGELFEAWLDRAANRVPGLRLVYNASKTTTEVTVGSESVQGPVKLEIWRGIRMTAFKTGHQTEDDRVMLFLPTAPNISTGFVLEADPDDITELDESTESALTRIISAGFGGDDETGRERSGEQSRSNRRPKP
ncbi:DUF502 domain-containing protein [Natronococcus sp. A-GB7]|uniref:DUF502 domain-containing protein n=1 Tax=Natronococcus sp. A-GB7 TaxID=3037649 RepID=UPI00241C2818|nr:DUF502 domain-containing protein [Natronococcus sp. A-GB7]MDG5819473.1 DUF502 domain-containing protein [Natronococcus sp. A-GB7]